jgi:hypothetical protein
MILKFVVEINTKAITKKTTNEIKLIGRNSGMEIKKPVLNSNKADPKAQHKITENKSLTSKETKPIVKTMPYQKSTVANSKVTSSKQEPKLANNKIKDKITNAPIKSKNSKA